MGRKKMDRNSKIREKMKVGVIYQTKPGGTFYLRYQINGIRRNCSLNTDSYEQARKNYENLLPTLTATDVEVVAAQVNLARRLSRRTQSLCLSQAWDKYSQLPERAMPSTVSEQQSYQITFREFCEFMGDPQKELHEISYEDALRFSEHMKTWNCAVDTHNRKIKRLRKIFSVLKEYCHDTENPFVSKTLLRSQREERDMGVRRLGFTAEQEKKILEVLDNPAYKVRNKPEIKVIFYLGMYTGQRLKDCVLLRWTKVNMKSDTIDFEQFKTGKQVSVPIAEQLKPVLKDAMKWKKDEFAYVCPNVAERYNRTDKNGKCIGNNLVNIDVLRVLRWTGIETSVKAEGRNKKVTVYGFHSLRHSFASHCAEAGVPRAVVQSFLGDETDILDQYYTHIGKEAQQEAIEALSGKIASISLQERIDMALSVINADCNPDEILLMVAAILKDKG